MNLLCNNSSCWLMLGTYIPNSIPVQRDKKAVKTVCTGSSVKNSNSTNQTKTDWILANKHVQPVAMPCYYSPPMYGIMVEQFGWVHDHRSLRCIYDFQSSRTSSSSQFQGTGFNLSSHQVAILGTGFNLSHQVAVPGHRLQPQQPSGSNSGQAVHPSTS